MAIAILMPAVALHAEEPYPLTWVRQLGTAGDDFASSVAIDHYGNALLGGLTDGNLGGPNAGAQDAFVAKYSTTGTLLWTRQLGTSSADFARSVAVDHEGNAILGGTTEGALDGPNIGNADAFIAKYSPAGAMLWTRQIGTIWIDFGYAIATDSGGNVFLTGPTHGSLGGQNAGDWDAFLVKYSPAGELLWARQIGSSQHDWPFGVAVDTNGNAIIGGRTLGSFAGPNAGNYDIFLAIYSPTGTLLWTRQLGTAMGDECQSVAFDGVGNVYLAGFTFGNLGGTSSGFDDAFIAKYSPTGSLLWIEQIGTTNSDFGYSVAVDNVGNAFLSGFTLGSLGATNAGDFDAFIAKYLPTGTLSWVQQIGTTSADYGNSIALDVTGNATLAGNTEGGLGGRSEGFNDAFVARYAAPVLGDTNGDGIVNVDDLLAVINAWGECPQPCPPHCAADVNDDCSVNVDDLLAVINNWG